LGCPKPEWTLSCALIQSQQMSVPSNNALFEGIEGYFGFSLRCKIIISLQWHM